MSFIFGNLVYLYKTKNDYKRQSRIQYKLPFCQVWHPEADSLLKPTVCLHVSGHGDMQTYATLVYTAHTHRDKESQGELKTEKKRALINCCLTLLDGDDPVHKSGFYGLYSVPNPLAFSLWSAQQSQDPK